MTHEELTTRLLKAEDALSELMVEHRALQRSHDELDELCAKMIKDVHILKRCAPVKFNFWEFNENGIIHPPTL